MRIAAIALTVVALACASTPASRAPVPDAVREFLIQSAATDFLAHRPPDPVRFRNVQLGHLPAADGSGRYLMCGEFLPAGSGAKWVPFATIKTSGYEQYIGETAYCHDPALVWDRADLSSSLQSRIDAMR